MGTQTMGSDTVAAAFRAAADDDSVKAIVFRIDSPGGSYVASDTIWHEVKRAQKAGKPVIASMGNVAGSGGYFVAMSADKIVAHPGTVTGSIGVLGGKMLIRDFLSEKLGITVDDLVISNNARMYLSTSPYTSDEWQRHEAWLDRVYEDFTTKAADGRHMELADVQAAARGRIWSGEDALRLGLVDELGGMPAALQLAKTAIGLAEDADVHVVVLPKERPWWQQLMEGTAGSSESAAAVLEDVRPILRAADAAGLMGDEQQLLTIPVEVPLP
jgi:protease-4